jgi:single-strand selective monofunctional uracil DNA glycosylase
MDLVRAADLLVRDLRPLRFGPPVAHVYNPLEYARAPYREYLRRFGRGPRRILLLGMNPGPWGMVQTGVPFGEVNLVRDWLGIKGGVGRPPAEHPRRPVLGFDCVRSEVSGARLWSWVRERFGPPERFFSRFFVANYCPLAFLEGSGRNRTPDKLPAVERAALFAVCDRHLRRTIEYLRPRYVIGVGRFAESRIKQVWPSAAPAPPGRAAGGKSGILVGCIPHPSPANPAANCNWAEAATTALLDLGIRLPGK